VRVHAQVKPLPEDALVAAGYADEDDDDGLGNAEGLVTFQDEPQWRRGLRSEASLRAMSGLSGRRAPAPLRANRGRSFHNWSSKRLDSGTLKLFDKVPLFLVSRFCKG
jgi:hypothetical protein